MGRRGKIEEEQISWETQDTTHLSYPGYLEKQCHSGSKKGNASQAKENEGEHAEA